MLIVDIPYLSTGYLLFVQPFLSPFIHIGPLYFAFGPLILTTKISDPCI